LADEVTKPKRTKRGVDGLVRFEGGGRNTTDRGDV
jgi:hypothetical protein